MPETQSLDLKNPVLGGVLAWVFPGAGHLYQGRFAKGLAFMACVLALFFYGSWFGRGRVVYHRWDENEKRWSYLMQLGVGLPAFPALLDTFELRESAAKALPPLATLQARPLDQRELEKLCATLNLADDGDSERLTRRLRENGVNYFVSMSEVDQLHRELGVQMDIALIYTMIAGLLNILVIYDAIAGPAHLKEDMEEDRKKLEEAAA